MRHLGPASSGGGGAGLHKPVLPCPASSTPSAETGLTYQPRMAQPRTGHRGKVRARVWSSSKSRRGPI
eukprot:1473061-Rhodomonas_salina.1